MTPHELDQWSHHCLGVVEDALSRWISPQAPAGLGEAMRYAVLDGGKRLRPLLVLAAREAIAHGTKDAALDEAALRAACAVELIHAYSLVHDDMPCMDNDVLRRGKPTVHVKFGEAQALLAGDALQALAFEFLTPEASAIPDGVQARLCRLLATAAGHAGMAGGQAIDLASVGVALTEAQLRHMHRLKTGALLEVSVMMGAACGEASQAALKGLQRYGQALGLAFQVWTTFWMSSLIQPRWAKPQAKMLRTTSPPMCRFWVWPRRSPTQSLCCKKPWRPCTAQA